MIPSHGGRIDSVLVIGAGPAGLAAVHAAAGLGYPVSVIAPRKKSVQRGPLLLQRPIPGLTTDHPDGYIRQIVIGGSILDYRTKVYGDVNISINGDILRDGYHAWRLPAVYDLLWERYSHLIKRDRKILPYELRELTRSLPRRLVVCTAPARDVCLNTFAHSFRYIDVPIIQRAVYHGQPEDTIIFNGDPDVCWTRSSRIFGHEVTEFRKAIGMPDLDKVLRKDDQIIRIRKPISHGCTCYPEVLRTGRFGAWRNETWVDTAYYDVRDALISDQRSEAWSAVLSGNKREDQ